jgi:outer membrane protein
MNRRSMKWMVGCALIFVCNTSPVSAQRTSDERVQQLIDEAAARLGVTQDSSSASGSPEATSMQPAPGDGQIVPLSLDDAIQLALSHNLDLAVQRLNPQTYDYSLANLRSAYRPTLSTTLGRESRTTPSTQTISGAAGGQGIVAGTTTFNGNLSQALPWGGGTLALTLNNTRATTTSATALFDPAYNSNWSATFTQPLLRNFRLDNTRQQILVTSLNREVSEIQLQATVINTLSNVSNAYWDYVYAVDAVGVAQRSVALAEQLVRDNESRVEVGTMAPIDIIQAQAQAATQRQNLAAAEGTRRTAELSLKRLITSGTGDPNWGSTLDPTDRPEFVPVEVDVPAAVRRALDARTDLAQARKTLQSNDVTLRYLKGQTLPTMNLSARYQLVGQGGTQFITEGSGINRTVVGTIPGGYGDAFNTLMSRNYPTWNVTLTVSYPVGTSSQDASLARARLQAKQVEAQLNQLELQVATDVTNAGTQVMNNIERVQAAQAARELAQQQLDAEQGKFEMGMSTNYFIVQAQRDLANAQNAELQARLAYRRSLVEFERLQQTSLGNANITILGGR